MIFKYTQEELEYWPFCFSFFFFFFILWTPSVSKRSWVGSTKPLCSQLNALPNSKNSVQIIVLNLDRLVKFLVIQTLSATRNYLTQANHFKRTKDERSPPYLNPLFRDEMWINRMFQSSIITMPSLKLDTTWRSCFCKVWMVPTKFPNFLPKDLEALGSKPVSWNLGVTSFTNECPISDKNLKESTLHKNLKGDWKRGDLVCKLPSNE